MTRPAPEGCMVPVPRKTYVAVRGEREPPRDQSPQHLASLGDALAEQATPVIELTHEHSIALR